MKRNPFYPISAATMLAGCLMLSEALEMRPGQLRGVLITIAALQLYEGLLVALGSYLIASKRAASDGVVVLALESAFLLDVTLLGTECLTVDLGVGSAVAAGAMALAIAKLVVVHRWAAEIVPGRTAHLLGDHAAIVFALPVVAGCLARPRLLSPGSMYGLWWLAAFPLALLARDLSRQAPGDEAEGSLPRQIWTWLPAASVLIHLIAVGWVHDIGWKPAFAAPFLLGLVASFRRDEVRRMAVLTAIAIVFSTGQVLETTLIGGREIGLSAFRGVLYGTALTCLVLARRFRLWPLAAAGAAGLLMLLVWSVQSLTEALSAIGRLLIPKTLLGWGILMVVASFVLLTIGARRSLRRPEPPTPSPDPAPGPGKPPGDGAPTGSPEDAGTSAVAPARRPPFERTLYESKPATTSGITVVVALLLLGFCAMVTIPSLFRCVVAGTMIATPAGSRAVESLQVGDVVWTKGAQGLEQGRLVHISRHVAWGHRTLALSDGRELGITSTHPIQTTAGWREAGTIRPGDLLHLTDGLVSVESADEALGPVVVYDLSVEPNETFFANGVLVHNKRPSSNESSAVGDTRSVLSGQAAYEGAAGSYGMISCLLTPSNANCISGYPATGPTFLDEALATLVTKNGYKRRFVPGPPSPSRWNPYGISSYCYSAVPLTPGQTGVRGFAGDQSGRICIDPGGADLCQGSSLPAGCTVLGQ